MSANLIVGMGWIGWQELDASKRLETFQTLDAQGDKQLEYCCYFDDDYCVAHPSRQLVTLYLEKEIQVIQGT